MAELEIRRPAVIPRAGDGAVDEDEIRALITVSRDHPRDCQQRQIVVRLDRQAPAQLLYGESFTLEVPPGVHHLRIHNTLFWKNFDFPIEAGEHLEFIAINEMRWWTAGVVGVLGSAPLFLKVERRSRR
jgi:hypothetical protein